MTVETCRFVIIFLVFTFEKTINHKHDKKLFNSVISCMAGASLAAIHDNGRQSESAHSHNTYNYVLLILPTPKTPASIFNPT